MDTTDSSKAKTVFNINNSGGSDESGKDKPVDLKSNEHQERHSSFHSNKNREQFIGYTGFAYSEENYSGAAPLAQIVRRSTKRQIKEGTI
jgi:hypothetical protein